jgi:monoamine oxidase
MKIAVVGLGAAGLRACMLLEQAGYEVTGFEARDRLGGRLYTVVNPEGGRYEAGGEWIDADHRRVLGLLAELGLEAHDRPSGSRRVSWRDSVCDEELLWSDVIDDAARFHEAVRRQCRGLSLPPWRNVSATELDEATVDRFIAENCRSERGRWYLNAVARSDEGEEPARVGLLGWLCGQLHYMDRGGGEMSSCRFPGGAGNVCNRIAQRLRADLRLNCYLRRVHQEGSQVMLDFDGFSESFDRVILTLPPRSLETVVFEPALPPQARCAQEACAMGRIIKLVWQFKEAWWRTEGWSGSLLTDGPLQQLWDGSLGETPTLTAYICGDEADRWAALGDPVRAGLFELGQMHSAAPDLFLDGRMHHWHGDPLAGGGFSYLAPGYVLGHMEAIAHHHHRVHFAGEHTANWSGFIEGALESAERAVHEIEAIEKGDRTGHDDTTA